jgi:uroporphyrinogen-III synthase
MPAIASAGCYVISLRPVGMHGAMRHAAAAHGLRVLALSPWKIVVRDDAVARRDLQAALACDRVLFTSPTAVRAATALQPLRARRGQDWFAVGSGTSAALRRAGIAGVVAPQRMDSEGLLALPGLQDVRGRSVGLVSAPGGRGVIAQVLRQRGAQVLRADVYDRVGVPLSPRAAASIRALDASSWLALSSGEALEHVLVGLPADAVQGLRRARVVAASARLAQLAHAHGFADVVVAASARPRDLLAAIALQQSASMRTSPPAARHRRTP